ncbi:MAG: bifunctional diguanylate cyclase/phosphodiesterase [Gammaproteobacteria bacterium]
MDTPRGMAGRAEFISDLDREIREHSQKDSSLAVLLLNIRGFRSINAGYGFSTADRVLQQIGEKILSIKRQQDLAGRVGIDEFALILPNLKSPYLAELAANKLVSELDVITLDDGSSINIKIHIGIVIHPEHGETSETLLQQADLAMYAARESYQPYKLAELNRHKKTSKGVKVSDLERAVSNNEFELYYQPKVDLNTHQLIGAEALIRWNDPKHGFIGPDEFITLAEQNGLIFPMTLWCLNTALRQSIEFRHLWPEFRIAINLSAITLIETELIELVKRALRTWDSPPDKLMIEVTESAIMTDPEVSIETLQGLRELGIKLSIDDFGTGYSSFSYLKNLPVHELKIDQSFIREMAKDANNGRIVQTMINLGENFDLSVIAEGIEDEWTLQQLVGMGCHHGQGYHIGRPMPRKKFINWIAESEWTRSALASPAK